MKGKHPVTIGTAWTQATWRGERWTFQGHVRMPLEDACLSFDGKTWEPVDSLVEQEKDQDSREWDSICRAFLRTELAKIIHSLARKEQEK